MRLIVWILNRFRVDGELNRFEVGQPAYLTIIEIYQTGSVNYLMGGFRCGHRDYTDFLKTIFWRGQNTEKKCALRNVLRKHRFFIQKSKDQE